MTGRRSGEGGGILHCIWEPLLAIADVAGKEWGDKGRQAAVGLTAKAQEDNPIGSLLVDLFILFSEQECTPGNEWMQAQGVRIFSRELVARLNTFSDRPWMNLPRGKEITETWLSQQLRPYGVRPRTVWIGEKSAKGYLGEDFAEVFRRYLPKAEVWAILNEAKAAEEEKPKFRWSQSGRVQNPKAPSCNNCFACIVCGVAWRIGADAQSIRPMFFRVRCDAYTTGFSES